MEIDEALRLLNEWWVSGAVKPELAKAYKRDAFHVAENKLQHGRSIIMLTGMRRVGKSTIMYQMISKLLQKVDKLKIIYFSFDYPNTELFFILNAYLKVTRIDWKYENVYIFLDEVQKLDGWAPQVKMLYDAYPNLHFVLSGSASLNLEKNAIADLAGRHTIIDIPVLSMIEYYSLKIGKRIENANIYKEEIVAMFDSYIMKPFPELVNIDDKKAVYEYISEGVKAKIISQDLLREFKDVDIKLLDSLVGIFFSSPGMILNIDSLSRSLAKRKQEVERHIFMLEYSKLLRIVKNYRPSIFAESRKMRKVYPYDISLALADNPSLETGKVMEALVISRLNIKRYWREREKEIDALIVEDNKIIPIEVKASSFFRDDYVSTIGYFLKRFRQDYGVVIYKGKSADRGAIKIVNVADMLIFGLSSISTFT